MTAVTMTPPARTMTPPNRPRFTATNKALTGSLLYCPACRTDLPPEAFLDRSRAPTTPSVSECAAVRAWPRTFGVRRSRSRITARPGRILGPHGHDHRVLHYAARVVQQCTGRDVLILHEQPNGGRTLLEKFEEEAAGAAYAVVLLTGDDEGGLVGAGTHTPRARQNVVFELAFFFGKLGRKRVSVLLDKGVEEPSDLNGLVYIPLADASWRYDLLKDVQAAGIPVDYSRIP